MEYIALRAFLPLIGLPMRIAVATVSGLSTGTKSSVRLSKAWATGAAPSAWMPVSIGTLSIQPTSWSSVIALYTAQMFAALPTGSTILSGTSYLSWSMISKRTDFWPSGLYGLMELSR